MRLTRDQHNVVATTTREALRSGFLQRFNQVLRDRVVKFEENRLALGVEPAELTPVFYDAKRYSYRSNARVAAHAITSAIRAELPIAFGTRVFEGPLSYMYCMKIDPETGLALAYSNEIVHLVHGNIVTGLSEFLNSQDVNFATERYTAQHNAGLRLELPERPLAYIET